MDVEDRTPEAVEKRNEKFHKEVTEITDEMLDIFIKRFKPAYHDTNKTRWLEVVVATTVASASIAMALQTTLRPKQVLLAILGASTQSHATKDMMTMKMEEAGLFRDAAEKILDAILKQCDEEKKGEEKTKEVKE